MKTYGILCFVLAISMLICPLLSLDYSSFSFDNVKNAITSNKTEDEEVLSDETAVDESGKVVKIKSTSGGNIISTTELDYLVGCVAAEMPASYHEEAIKAQAVAAYTNLKRMQKNPDASLDGADITDSPSTHQGYYDEKTQREKWGDKYEAYHEKIETAVKEIFGKKVMYENELITAAYCAICPGRSESAKNIWGGDIPYLQSVVSTGDKLSPDYTFETAFTAEQFKEKAASDKEIALGDDPAAWIGDVKYSENNTNVVLSIVIGGKSITGMKVRELFGLRSPSLQVTFSNGSFIFKNAGYGHTVGMSQYGADYMARQGSTYIEILEHYYKGAKVV